MIWLVLSAGVGWLLCSWFASRILYYENQRLDWNLYDFIDYFMTLVFGLVALFIIICSSDKSSIRQAFGFAPSTPGGKEFHWERLLGIRRDNDKRSA